MIKNTLSFLCLIGAAFFHISFIPALPYPWNSTNVLLCAVIFGGLFIDFSWGARFAFAGGLVWDLYNGFPFGGYALTLLLTLFALFWVFENFFTNRSLYTLSVLGALGTVIFNLIFGLLHFSSVYENIGTDFFVFVAYQTVFNLAFLIALFIIVHATSKRFQSIFLTR